MAGEWWVCCLCTCNFYLGEKEGRKYWTVLSAFVIAARSENGFIHVWNLKTHRVDAALDGHGRKSVFWLEKMDGEDRLLRLVRLQTKWKLFLSLLYTWVKKKEQQKNIRSRTILFLESLIASPAHTENVQKYKYPELLWSVNFFMMHVRLHCSVTTRVSWRN